MAKPSGLKLYPEKIDALFLKGDLLKKSRRTYCYHISWNSRPEEESWTEIEVQPDYRNKNHARKLEIISYDMHYTEDPSEIFEGKVLAKVTSMKQLETFCEKFLKSLECQRLANAETMMERRYYRM